MGRNPAQDGCAECWWVDRCMGREVHAARTPPLQYCVVASLRIPLSEALIAAPKAHPLQDLRR
eukprot:5349071-Alexandrium_andersonii.AAC.1